MVASIVRLSLSFVQAGNDQHRPSGRNLPLVWRNNSAEFGDCFPNFAQLNRRRVKPDCVVLGLAKKQLERLWRRDFGRWQGASGAHIRMDLQRASNAASGQKTKPECSSYFFASP
jgi:hypothetical protein